MGGGPKRQKYRRANTKGSSPDDQTLPNADSPVSKAFLEYKGLLDSKHDKHEALVKISRDVTIESKRIIFHLHRCIGGDREQLLLEAEQMIEKCIKVLLFKMAKELEGVDHYIHTRAITAGLQEFVEAYTFYIYIKEETIPTLDDVSRKLCFSKENLEPDGPEDSKSGVSSVADGDSTEVVSQSSDVVKTGSIHVPLSQTDFILGIADLTGELMRMSINSIGWGDMLLSGRLCAVLQYLQITYQKYCSTAGGEMARKVQTLKHSVAKVENACYTLKIRGSEIPKHMLAHTIETGEKMVTSSEPDTAYDWL